MFERFFANRRVRAAARAAGAGVTSTRPQVMSSDSSDARAAIGMNDDDPRPKWEYIPIIVPNTADLIASLNKAGRDGWEIVCPTGAVEDSTMWLAKRRKRAIIEASSSERKIIAAR